MKKVILTRGLPGSGKSSWAKAFVASGGFTGKERWHIVERDMIRAELYPDWPQYKPKRHIESEVTKVHEQQIIETIGIGFGCIVSDTNLNPSTVDRLIKLVESLGATWEFKDFLNVPLKEVKRRNLARPNSVPDHVYETMSKKNPDLFPWVHTEFSIPVGGVFKPNPKNGKCVIVDIDGTIADHTTNTRSPFDMTRVAEDTPHLDVIQMIAAVVQSIHSQEDCEVIVMSGRSGTVQCRADTEAWLCKWFPYYDQLWMRAEDDTRQDSIVKEELFWKHVAPFYNPVAVFDDRMQVVKLWANLGLRVYQVYTPGKDNNDF